MRGAVWVVLGLLLASAAAAEPVSDAPKRPTYPSGIFSHGDVGDFVEDSYGRPPERGQPEDPAARRKHDPALRWDGPATGR